MCFEPVNIYSGPYYIEMKNGRDGAGSALHTVGASVTSDFAAQGLHGGAPRSWKEFRFPGSTPFSEPEAAL